MKGRAAGSMSRRVDDANFDALTRHGVAILHKPIDSSAFGYGYSDPLCLHIELVEQKQVRFVNGGWSAEAILQILNRSDVVDVSVCADNLLRVQVVFCKTSEDFFRIVPRIDDDRVAGLFIAKNGAIALKKSDRKCLDNHPTAPLSRL